MTNPNRSEIALYEWDRAFVVTHHGYEDSSAVVYAPWWKGAKVEGVGRLNEHGACWASCTVRRAPEYDACWPSGPSFRESFEKLGWRFFCPACEHVVRPDGCGDCAGPVVLDDEKENAYCNQACVERYQASVLEMRKENANRRRDWPDSQRRDAEQEELRRYGSITPPQALTG